MLAIIITVAQILGVLSSISALLTTRTSQGTIAWIVSLNTFPYVAVPAYWIFGRTQFNGYVQSRKEVDARLRTRVGELRDALIPWRRTFSDTGGGLASAERLAKLPFTVGNRAHLLINGPAAFEQMFDAIERAERYVLIQFYIVRSDRFGHEFKELLLRVAGRGVRVYFLFDEIGSYAVSSKYLRELRDGGVRIQPFSSTRGPRNRFQLNFRNHRKVLVVDGIDGYLGGLNIGEEYLGLSEKFGMWRDTHIRLQGPALVGLQLPFVEDWHWATGEYLELDWVTCSTCGYDPEAHESSTVLVLPSGPADDYPTASMMIQHAIHSATHRFWIASPYFVPDDAVQDALILAALRGVDVRVLIPDRPDHVLVYLSAFAFLGRMIDSGVRVFRFRPAFLHEKVFLVDEQVAGVGTVNLDNRSFRLNFEITAIVLGTAFAHDVHDMFIRDFSKSREISPAEMHHMPIWLRVASRLAHLLAPIQ
ncbi:MAG: cardiolipin synthase [Alkalispirochaeta sp.]